VGAGRLGRGEGVKKKKKAGRVVPPLLERHFELSAHSPRAWAMKAHPLRVVADLLGDRIEEEEEHISASKMKLEDSTYIQCLFVFALLAGAAIENLAKALVMKSMKDPADRRKLSEDLGGHSTSAYLRRVRFPLSKEETVLVTWLEMAVVWTGRYPVAKKVETMDVAAFTTGQIPLFRQLYDRLEARVLARPQEDA
jgi:hypothetical protein